MLNLVPFDNGRIGMPTLWGWEPFRLFDDLLGGEVVWDRSPVKIQHDRDRALITADMPGVDPSDLDLTFDNGALTITGQRGDQRYQYVVTLGDGFDPDAIEAQLDKGVLSIKAEKKPEARPRKIALQGTANKSLGSGESR